MSHPPNAPDIDHLATPLAWLDDDGILRGCNSAFARWLDTSPRKLTGLPLERIDAQAPHLSSLVERMCDPDVAPVHVRRATIGLLPGVERLADLWLSRVEHGVLLEAHPLDDFPAANSHALPDALHAALQGLAHEVRNPLAGMRGAAQLLARRSEDADARRYIEVILHECDRLAGLVDRLLNPTRPGSPLSTNVHEALERVRLLAQAQAGDSMTLHRDYDPSLPEVHGNPDRLAQALWNLVRNAMEAGAHNLTLRTRAEHHALIGERSTKLALRIEIEDDGQGVSEALGERIFLPLISGRAEGTGLGLTLVQQVAHEHGGALSYRSRPGQTVFVLRIPVE
ncbi:ATP-binding protein [Xanthomonadaceae bacterium JHOS43]|nr:ATP-binding protein [Xanthomonadaceae bacterium JHOS43]MCX7564239.1 ATP-binding protein [Xanthomonadaceae bacterium XH05]